MTVFSITLVLRIQMCFLSVSIKVDGRLTGVFSFNIFESGNEKAISFVVNKEQGSSSKE